MIKDTNSGHIVERLLTDDGTYPNNERLPLLFYTGVITLAAGNAARTIEELFHVHHWGSSWRNGIFNYHHYHSTAHEVLGVYSGTARVQLGGPQGSVFEVRPGDVIVIPAGIAHRNLGSSPDFALVGAYPDGQNCDMNYGENSERPRADRNIAGVPLPGMDPVFGATGPLMKLWHNK